MDETGDICFICDKKISSGKWKYKLQVTATKKRNVPAEDLIKQLVGEEYAVLVGERDAVCSKCMNLLNLMDTLTFQLEEVTGVLTKLLHTKYNLASEFNSFQVDYDDTIVEKSEPLHSCNKCSFETKYEKEFNKHMQTHSTSRTPPTKTSQTKLKSSTKTVKKPKSTPALPKPEKKSSAATQVGKTTPLFTPSRTVTRSSTNSLKRKRRYSDSSDDKPVSKKTASSKLPSKKSPVKKTPKPKKSKVLYQCSACDKTFPTETLIQAHAEREHGIGKISVTEEEYADIQTLESSDDEVTVVSKGRAKNTKSKKGLLDTTKLDFLDDWEEDENDEITSPNKNSNIRNEMSEKSLEVKKKGKIRPRQKSIDFEVEDDDKDTTSSPTCLFCHATFSSLESVQDHIKMFHSRPKSSKMVSKPVAVENDGSFEIDSTTEILDSKSRESGRVKSSLTSKSYKCNLCGIKKVSLQFIQKHIKKHRRRMSLQCKYCAFTCRNIVGLKLHASRCCKVSCIPKKCSFCNFKFLTHNQLRNHIRKVHHKIKGYNKCVTNSTLSSLVKLNNSNGRISKTLDNQRGNLTSATDSRKISSSEVSSTSFETELLNKKEENDDVKVELQEKKFKCEECSKSFERPSLLNVHVSRHRASKCTSLGICVYCNKLFLSKEQVVLHINVIHQDLKESPFCEICRRSYSYMKDLKTHYIKSHWNDLTEILVAQAMQQEQVKSKLRKNASVESNDVYNKVFKELQDLTGEGNDTEHISAAQHSPLFYSCPLCNYASRLEEEVKSHLKIHKKNYCNICKNIFSYQELIRHLENHSVLFQNKECFECKGTFHDSVHLQFHIHHDHPGEKPFKCSMCANSYYSTKSLMNHKQKKHAKKAMKVFPCNWCKKKFLSNKLYQVHVEYGHRSSLNCKYCDKALNNVKGLILHEKNHLKQVKSICKCNICGKVLKNLASLKSHKLNHVNSSSLKCDVCSKSFKSFHSLREHSANHTGTHELKYFCDICGKGFYFYDSHYRHRRIHLEPVCLQCKNCEESFPDGDTLQEHKKVCTAT